MSLFRELQRRNVLRVAAGYVAVAWLVVQVMDTLSEAFGFTGEHLRIAVIVLAVGLIPVLLLSWAFELTPDGIKRDADARADNTPSRSSSKRFDRMVIAVMAIALTYFVIDEIFFETAPVLTEAERSIAVLPFVNMSSDAEQEFFSDGISEEMLNLLARIPELRVISRTSAFQYKGSDKEIPQIAAELRVAHVLEGSVRKAGNTIRITAQLIHGPTDAHVWSETWDRELDDVFAIQDEIAAEVVSRLRVELLGEVPQAQTVDPDAYVLYLRAHHVLNFGGSGSLQENLLEAADYLERALEIAPDYVDALTDLALTNWRLWTYDPRRAPDDPRLVRSSALLERARAIDPDDPAVLVFTAYGMDLETGKTADVAALYERALSAAPDDEDAIRVGMLFARSIGRWDTAIEIAEYNTSRNPRCASCFYQLSQVYRDSGNFEQARRAGEAANALGIPLEFSLARTQLLQGNPQPLLDFYSSGHEKGWQQLTYHAMALHTAGNEEESAALMQEAESRFADSFPFEVATGYAWRGDADAAFRMLERSLMVNRTKALYWNQNPEFRPIHDDPRWDDFLRRIERHPEQLAEIRFDPKIPD